MYKHCIYCDSTNLNLSDIIPACITMKNYTKKFVCKTHNSYIGNYEAVFAQKSAFIRNLFEKMIRKSKKLVSFKARLTINKEIFDCKNFTSLADLCWNNEELISNEGISKKFVIKNNDNVSSWEEIKEIKVEFIEFTDFISSLFEKGTLRIIAKIGYEYYREKNSWFRDNDCFTQIINFIINENDLNDEIVVPIYSESIDGAFHDKLEYGNHTIFHYTDNEATDYVIFKLWGLITYKIRVYKHMLLLPVSATYHINNFSSYRFDGKTEKNPFSSLSIIYSFGEKIDCEKYKKIIKERLLELLNTRMVSENYLRCVIKRFKVILSSKKSIEDQFAYFVYGDLTIMTCLHALIKFYENKSKISSNISFDEKMKLIYNGQNKIVLNDSDIKNMLSKYKESEFIKLLSTAIEHFEESTKEKTNEQD